MHPRNPALTLTLAASIAASLTAARPARADDPVAESRISRVTVYEDRALVERTATVTVGAGTTRIVLPGFPAGFDPNSLRARCSKAQVLGVDTVRVHLVRESLAEAEAARKAWDAARRESQAAEMDLVDAKDAWERLKSIRAAATQKGAEATGGKETDVRVIEQMLGLVDEKGRGARRRIVDAQAALETAKSAEDAARLRMEEFASAAQREETRVVVTLTAAAAGDADLTVRYMVGNAGWTPVYDVRMAEDFSASALEMTAVVAQRTGEDWSGVPLEVTTAQPAAGAAPPQPNPWIVDLLSEHSEMARASPTADAASPAMERRALGFADKDAGFAAPIRRSGVVVAFTAPLPANVRSDGQPSRVALGRFDLAPKVRWEVFPKATDKTFVTAKVKNATGTALPAGEARIFVGPDFVGGMALGDWGMEKEIDVGLGVDREVEVTRELLKKERSTEGVFTKDTVHDRAFRITVKNHRARAIDLRVLDQVPVSHDEDLKVELGDMNQTLAKLPDREAEDNKARGVLEWRLGLGAKKELDLRFAFRVVHPRDRTVLGMDD